MATLQEKLSMYLRERNLSMRALSLRAGLEESAVKQIMYGKSKNPRLDTLKKICSVLGCTLDGLTEDVEFPVLPRAMGLNETQGKFYSSSCAMALYQNRDLFTLGVEYAKQILEPEKHPAETLDVCEVAQYAHDICVRLNILHMNADLIKWVVSAMRNGVISLRESEVPQLEKVAATSA